MHHRNRLPFRNQPTTLSSSRPIAAKSSQLLADQLLDSLKCATKPQISQSSNWKIIKPGASSTQKPATIVRSRIASTFSLPSRLLAKYKGSKWKIWGSVCSARPTAATEGSTSSLATSTCNKPSQRRKGTQRDAKTQALSSSKQHGSPEKATTDCRSPTG
jgi:hypothetical protein